MPSLRYQHLNDFTLLRYASGELGRAEERDVRGHLETCKTCQGVLTEIEELDRELSAIARDPSSRADLETEDLPPGDPFLKPASGVTRTAGKRLLAESEIAATVEASEQGLRHSANILQAVKEAAQDPETIVSQTPLTALAHRFALLYALQQAGREMAENPSRFMALAEKVLALAPERGGESAQPTTSNQARGVPFVQLRAQANLLAGQGRLWTGELELAGSHFADAYQGFSAIGDDVGIARAEHFEAQRRFYTGLGEEALTLSRRASVTFALLGLEDEQARARGAEGMALFQMGRWQEAAAAFQEAIAVFERYELWSNYVGMLNSLCNALVKLGQLGEARRAYARALRRLSHQRHRSWVPFIRKGLAEVLFSAGDRKSVV